MRRMVLVLSVVVLLAASAIPAVAQQVSQGLAERNVSDDVHR